MAGIELRAVTGAPRDGRPLVSGMSLAVNDREVVALLGPSGSGKTTVLRIVAGLEDVTAGDVLLGGARANDLPPDRRDLALVTEEQPLLGHLDVERNIGFALRLRRVDPVVVRERVRGEARVFGLARLLRRRPRTLAAGERQAASIARATVRVPSAFLLDEPLSRIDARERVRLRTELAAYVRGLGVTTLLATNDQGDALAVAARVAVLRAGRLEQVGTPEEVYRRPANRFVATFVGDPGMNVLQATLEAGRRTNHLRVGRDSVVLPALPEPLRRAYDGSAILFGVRPDHVRVAETGAAGALPATVEASEYLGAHTRLLVRLAATGDRVTVREAPVPTPAAGSRVWVRPRADRVHLFDPTSEEAVWVSL